MDLQRISDELEITRLLHRYARAVDGRDWDLWRSLFTTDAQIDYSSAGGVVGGPEEVSAWLERSLAVMPMTQHYISNVEADVTGDTAAVRAMFYNPMLLPGATRISACGGYYHHRMVRTAGGWLSAGLREENLWFDNPPTPEARAALQDRV